MRIERLIKIKIQDTLRLTAARLEKKTFRSFKAFKKQADKDFPWDRKTTTSLRRDLWDSLAFKLYMVMHQRAMIRFPWYMPIVWKAKHLKSGLSRLCGRVKTLFIRSCIVCGKATVIVDECYECKRNYSTARKEALREINTGARKSPEELLSDLP